MSNQDFSHALSKKQKIASKEEEEAAAAGYSKAHKVVDLNLKNENMIVCLDMCYFCFDVLIAHLNNYEDPVATFSNKQ